MRKATVGVAALAAAAAGSAMLGGAALATEVAGAGVGGKATNNCLNVGVPILSGIGAGGIGSASGASCSAVADGTGGSVY
ncbi:MAG: hypothetical protein JO100_07715 [Pseudonocardia sp.]|nr:hypothetical protein [Pseudonocardia sp.]